MLLSEAYIYSQIIARKINMFAYKKSIDNKLK